MLKNRGRLVSEERLGGGEAWALEWCGGGSLDVTGDDTSVKMEQ